METFGCCSKYIECSDAKECFHKHDFDYEGCMYRANLEAGRIFYGKNAFVKVMPEPTKKVAKYLYCYDRLFTIKARAKNSYSYDLSAEQFVRLCTLFNNLEIPYKTELAEDKCFIDRPEKLDLSPANSRVVIMVGDEQFNVSNYNNYLIKARYSKKISTAFETKGLISRVELMGQYYNVESVLIFKEEYTPPSKEIKSKYEQISLFQTA